MSEANQINCPHCGQSYTVRPEQWALYDGKSINCTKCGQSFAVRSPAPPASVFAPPGPAAPQQPPNFPPAGTLAYVAGANYLDPPPMPVGNGWALSSLILGFVGFCVPVLGGIAAVVTGIVGLLKTREPGVKGKGMAIAGISLGGVSILVTPVIVMMIAILLPALTRAREQANRVKCAADMRGLGQAMMMYANNNGGHFPDKLEDVLQADPLLTPGMFVCPSDDKSPPTSRSAQAEAHEISDGQHCSYIYVGNELTTSAPADSVLLYEPLGNHRSQGSNVLFADGHVEWVDTAEAEKIAGEQASDQRPIRATTAP